MISPDDARSPSVLGHAAAASAERSMLSVVLPYFNEVGSLGELHRRVAGGCHQVAGHDYEVVLIDDGFRDANWGIIASLSAMDPDVIGVQLSRNHGHQLALSAGPKECRGELASGRVKPYRGPGSGRR